MSQVVILGDVHIGARNDSNTFMNYHISFFEEQLFPFLKENKIKRVIQLGDIFDRRKFVNFQVLNEWKRRVFDWMFYNGIEMDVIVGNHDIYFKNTNDVNSPILLLSEYVNIKSHVHATEVMIQGTNVLFVPWINDSNVKTTMELVKKTKATVAMGHFEFDGFEMDKGHKHEGGTNASKFKKFDTVLSGHFHHKSDDGHVFYLGVPYQITWIDHDSQKGFHTWDPATLELEFIPNNKVIFKKIIYNDDGEVEDYWKTVDVEDVANMYLKVIVVNKKDLYGFDRFMSKMYAMNPSELKVIENTTDFDADNVHDEDLKIDDTSTLLEQYIDAADTNLDKDRLKRFVKQLHTEAQHLEGD